MDDSSNPEIAYELLPLIRVYKDGQVERLHGTDTLPACTDSRTGVTSKDIIINPETDVSARIYLPTLTNPNQKLPLLIYFHGGGFCVVTPCSSKPHSYLNALVAESKIVAIAVNYRKAPEYPLPTAYKDSWAALQWVVSHSDPNRGSDEEWLKNNADFERVFLAGDSAGANIAHNLAMLAGEYDLGLKFGIMGIAMIHPYFWGSVSIGSESTQPERKGFLDRLLVIVCPSASEGDVPWLNPVAEGAPSLVGLNCRRVVVCVAEKDVLRDRGRVYYEALSKSGWLGMAEFHESEGEDHVFHLNDLEGQKAKDLIQHLASFFHRDMPSVI